MLDAKVLPVLEHPEGDLVIMEWMLIKSIPFNVIKEKPSNKLKCTLESRQIKKVYPLGSF